MSTVPNDNNPEGLSAADTELIRRVGDRITALQAAEKRLATLHAWTVSRDLDSREFVWRCTCGYEVRQAFGDPAPADQLISHPRGE